MADEFKEERLLLKEEVPLGNGDPSLNLLSFLTGDSLTSIIKIMGIRGNEDYIDLNYLCIYIIELNWTGLEWIG